MAHLQPLERLAQQLVLSRLHREEAAIDHRHRLAIALEWRHLGGLAHEQYRPLFCPWLIKPFRDPFDMAVTEAGKWPVYRKLLGAANVSVGLPVAAFFGVCACRIYANATMALEALSAYDPCWYNTSELERCNAGGHHAPWEKTNLTKARRKAAAIGVHVRVSKNKGKKLDVSNKAGKKLSQQMAKNDHDTANFLWKFSRLTTPRLILLEFPRHVVDGGYSYDKLRELVSLFGVSKTRFLEVYATLSRGDLVHNLSGQSSEW